MVERDVALRSRQKIAVLITCYNRVRKTLECLQSLFEQRVPEQYELEVYLVDDASPDLTGEKVKEMFPEVNVINGSGNLYWNRGMYLAWSEAEKSNPFFYLWLNDDTMLSEDALSMILEASESKKNEAIIVGTTKARDGSISYGGRLYDSPDLLTPGSEPVKCDVFNGNIIYIPRSVYCKIGKLDPLYWHAIGDFDYALRAKKAGIENYIAAGFSGVCENRESLMAWCDQKAAFMKRIRSLYSPLGCSQPYYFFRFEFRHYGLFQALKHLLSIHLRLLFPELWTSSNNIDFFQTDSLEIKKAYRELDNYQELLTSEGDPEVCAVYFSSNGIYNANNPDVFNECIINKDRFEWKKNLIPYAGKHFFLRDIKKQWYLDGINASVNSPEKLLDFLREKTAGCRTVCIGSSAGGYAAILYGSLLNAELIFSFNGQFDLREYLKYSKRETDPLLFDYADKLGMYYRVSPFIKAQKNIFYFQSSKSSMDMRQFEQVDAKCINRIRFKTANHGIPFPRCCLQNILNMTKDQLYAMSGKQFRPVLFSFRQVGVWKTFSFFFNFFIKKQTIMSLLKFFLCKLRG